MALNKSTKPNWYWHDYALAYTILPLIPRFVHPNHLTILRFVMVPMVIWLLAVENYAWGVPMFFLAGLTDLLDGSLARTRNQITPWGIFFDPIADKLLIGSVAILVAIRYYHPVIIVTGIFLDSLPAVGWALGKFSGRKLGANWWGKIKMCLQVLALLCLLVGLLLDQSALIEAGEYILILSLVFSLLAVITYSL